jgi:hypothetical protein
LKGKQITQSPERQLICSQLLTAMKDKIKVKGQNISEYEILNAKDNHSKLAKSEFNPNFEIKNSLNNEKIFSKIKDKDVNTNEKGKGFTFTPHELSQIQLKIQQDKQNRIKTQQESTLQKENIQRIANIEDTVQKKSNKKSSDKTIENNCPKTEEKILNDICFSSAKKNKPKTSSNKTTNKKGNFRKSNPNKTNKYDFFNKGFKSPEIKKLPVSYQNINSNSKRSPELKKNMQVLMQKPHKSYKSIGKFTKCKTNFQERKNSNPVSKNAPKEFTGNFRKMASMLKQTKFKPTKIDFSNFRNVLSHRTLATNYTMNPRNKNS